MHEWDYTSYKKSEGFPSQMSDNVIPAVLELAGKHAGINCVVLIVDSYSATVMRTMNG